MHDSELCKRLAVKVMEWEEVEIAEWNKRADVEKIKFITPHRVKTAWVSERAGRARLIGPVDFCCNPAHCWILEQKMTELGFKYLACEDRAAFTDGNWDPDTDDIMLLDVYWPPPKVGADRLHATSLAAWEAVKDD